MTSRLALASLSRGFRIKENRHFQAVVWAQRASLAVLSMGFPQHYRWSKVKTELLRVMPVGFLIPEKFQ